MDRATPNLDKKQDVIGAESISRLDFGCKEIGGDQEVPVYANKLTPGGSLFSF